MSKIFYGLISLILLTACATQPLPGTPKPEPKPEPQYSIYQLETGNDHVREGYFRITDPAGKIGYAQEDGTTAITPQFAFGFPFIGGVAKVTYTGSMQEVPGSKGKNHYWKSRDWFYVNTSGQRITTKKESD